MDLLAQYSENSKSEESETYSFNQFKNKSKNKDVSSAPEVDTQDMVMFNNNVKSVDQSHLYTDPSNKKVYFNAQYEDMYAPVVGPKHPFNKDGMASGMRNHRGGQVERYNTNLAAFEDQLYTYDSRGYAVDPASGNIIGNQEVAKTFDGDGIFGISAKRKKTKEEKELEKQKKQQRLLEQDNFDPEEPFQLQNQQIWADQPVPEAELNEEQKKYLEEVRRKKEEEIQQQENQQQGKQGANSNIKTIFHPQNDKDYQSRSWLEPQKGLRKESDYCYLPKQCIHTWTGHNKGVNAIRFFPGTGHLLLSAGLEGKVKIWDVHNQRKCIRTYIGHTKGVRDIQFSADGRRFLSSGYDRQIHLWDTETGQVIRTISINRVFYTVKFHPGHQFILGGCSDKKIYQFDLESGDCVTEYDYHLGAVNTITFVDEGRRFISTSDDKTIRVWEFGIPVQIKYIADPSMHSIPSIALHPNGSYFIGQSLDNQILTFSTRERFRQNRKKTFKGHTTAGYACQVNFSPDAQYVLSGDGEGKCFFWEWQHPSKIVRTLQAHDGVCIGCEWNPLETSKVATCGWDGQIKYWD